MTIQSTLGEQKGFILFTILAVSIALVVVYYITFVYGDLEYQRALNDLNKVTTCSGLIMFDSNNNEYNINIWGADKLHKAIVQKLGDMKCP